MSGQDPTKVNPLPSYKQIRQTIPKRCFERPILKSIIFPIRDIILLLIIGYAAIKFIPFQISLVSIMLWTIYAIVQGSVAFSIFVIGHDCGHGAFSQNPIVSDIVGYITHTFLLAPYFAWQKSHAVHHSKNNHLLDNQSHVPDSKQGSQQYYQKISNTIGHSGFIILKLIIHSAIGWIAYLFYHVSGSKRNPFTKAEFKSIPNHFSPFPINELFGKEMRFKIFLSTLGVVAMVCGLTYFGWLYGFKKVIFLYIGPYNVVYTWLALVTWLHHTQPQIPHYGENEWNWLKGAVSTIDRNYPWFIDQLHHHIGTTHVLHHIIPEIPHYHAVQATKAIIAILGKNYRFDPSSITSALWKLSKTCHYVESLEGIQYYKGFKSLAQGQKSQ